MRFEVLGPLRVLGSDGPVDIGPPKRRALLAFLLIHAGHTISADRLLDALWHHELPQGGVKTLHVHVSKLRSALRAGLAPGEAEPIVTEATGYRLDVSPGAVDAAVLEHAVAEAEEMGERDPDAGSELLRLSLSAVRGRPYDDAGIDLFAGSEIRRLEELIVAARELKADLDLRRGRTASVIADLESIVSEHPHRERSWGLLMLAFYRAGRQSDALRAFNRATRILGEELGIEPGPELRRLEEQILLQDESLDAGAAFTATASDAGAPVPLPVPLTSFEGRAAELAELRGLLERARLVTVAGPAGVGKTRLALEVAHAYGRGDAWFARLGLIRDANAAGATICEAVGAAIDGHRSAQVALVHWARRRRGLLLIDNCEHVLEVVAPLIADVAAAAPGLRIVATSRRPLDIAGEVVFRIGSLSLPEPGSGTEGLESSDAGRLLLARRHAAVPGRRLDTTDVEAAIEVCRAVDGIPLAIELVAVKLRTMSMSEIAERLSDRFSLLGEHDRTAEPHQRTLEAAIDWSYQLLGSDERTALHRLSVFHGGWTLDAAEQVAGGSPLHSRDVARLVSSLADASLVVAEEHGGETRYHLLESVRQFAAARLENPEEVHRRLVDHLRDLARRSRDEAAGGVDALIRLEAEAANVRNELARASAEGDAATVLGLIADLGPFFEATDLAVLPLGWIESIEDGWGSVDPELAARALTVSGELALHSGLIEQAQRLHRAALELNPSDGIARFRAHSGLGRSALEVGDRADASTHFEAARRVAEKLGDSSLLGSTLRDLAAVSERATQRELLEDALEADASIGSLHGQAVTELGLGWLEVADDALDLAGDRFARASRLAAATSNEALECLAQLGLGDVFRIRGDLDAAEGHYVHGYQEASSLDSDHLVALAADRLGELDRRRLRLDEAQVRLAESLRRWRHLPRQPGRALTLTRLALLACDEERFDLAARHAEEATELWERFHRRDGVATAQFVASRIEAGLGRRDAARVARERALAAWRRALDEPAVLDPWMAPDAAETTLLREALGLTSRDGSPSGREALIALVDAAQRTSV